MMIQAMFFRVMTTWWWWQK